MLSIIAFSVEEIISCVIIKKTTNTVSLVSTYLVICLSTGQYNLYKKPDTQVRVIIFQVVYVLDFAVYHPWSFMKRMNKGSRS